MAKGSIQGNLSSKELEEIEIPIPPKPIQELIIEKLDVLNNNIERSKEMVKEYKNIIKYYVDCHTRNENEFILKDICLINSESLGSVKPKFINYIDISSIESSKIVNITKLEKEFPTRAKRIIKKGDILLSTVRPNLRNYAYVDNEVENGICSTGFCVIRTNSDNFINKLIYYQIQSDDVTNYLVNNATGSQYPAVNSSIVDNIKVKIPSKEKQEEIVKYCDNLSDIITKIETQIKDEEILMKQILENYLNVKKDDNKVVDNKIVDDEKPKKINKKKK
jgi:type I restriction enzyme S subunit